MQLMHVGVGVGVGVGVTVGLVVGVGVRVGIGVWRISSQNVRRVRTIISQRDLSGVGWPCL